MKLHTRFARQIATSSLICLATSCAFADSTGAAPGQGETVSSVGETQVFFGVRPWAAIWDTPLLDAAVVIPNSGPPPVVRTLNSKNDSDVKIVPLTTLGVRHKAFSLAATFFPQTDFSSGGRSDSAIRRSELDIALSYALSPNLLASVVYKTGKVSQGVTRDMTALTNLSVSYRISGFLVGLNASAPLQDRLSLYGSFAYGLAKEKSSQRDVEGEDKYDATYKIGEVGLSYRIMDGNPAAAIKSLSAQIGYRFQIVTVKDFPTATLSIPGGTVLSVEHQSLSSLTHGPVFGIVGAF